MIDCLSVLSALRGYYSVEGTDEELAPICTMVIDEILPSVKSKEMHSDARLTALAAATVNYRLCIRKLGSSDNVTSFKAGDVTVSVSPSVIIEQAEKEKTEAYLAALPLLKDDKFLFKQVSV